MGNRLYLRIWLAVILAVAVLTFLVGWAWRMAADPPLRDAVVRSETGEIIGRGQSRGGPHGIRSQRDDDDDKPRIESGPASKFPAPGTLGPGPEFIVQMANGEALSIHLPRQKRSFWQQPPFGFLWTLGLVGVAVALATYPIIRKLTRRLELLQQGVAQWGAGDLSHRLPIKGNDEVAFLSRQFNLSAERVETLVKSHKSLLANASHELRSPLTRIRMGMELMSASPSPAFKTEILRNLSELDQLIDEILLASRLDAKEADIGTIEQIDLAGLAAEECARSNVEMSLMCSGDEALVRGVPRLLRRVIRNLLENAHRYSNGEAQLYISREGRQVVIRVADQGPGVPVALRERIFEPFYRLPGASEREGGVGLGLALVRSIVERHSGTVYCEGREGEGAVFVVKLPAYDA